MSKNLFDGLYTCNFILFFIYEYFGRIAGLNFFLFKKMEYLKLNWTGFGINCWKERNCWEKKNKRELLGRKLDAFWKQLKTMYKVNLLMSNTLCVCVCIFSGTIKVVINNSGVYYFSIKRLGKKKKVNTKNH